MRRILSALTLSALLLGGVAGRAGAADVGVSVNIGDFHVALGDHYGYPYERVAYLQEMGLPYQELPVALYLAQQARVEPMTVVDMRLGGSSWHDICLRHNLSPDAFYVPLNEPIGPYSQIYSRPQTEWRSARFVDEDYVNLAGLRFVHDYYDYEPQEIVRLRSRGNDFLDIIGLLANITATAAYFNTPRTQVYGYYDRGLSLTELPLALFLASQARVQPMTVVDLRLGGSPWHDIYHRYNVSPEILYVPVREVYGPYARMYSQFRRYPRTQWRSLRFSDADYLNLAHLKIMTEHYRYEPSQVMRIRARKRAFSEVYRVVVTERRARRINEDVRVALRSGRPLRIAENRLVALREERRALRAKAGRPAIGVGELRKLEGDSHAAIGRGEARKLGVEPRTGAGRRERVELERHAARVQAERIERSAKVEQQARTERRDRGKSVARVQRETKSERRSESRSDARVERPVKAERRSESRSSSRAQSKAKVERRSKSSSSSRVQRKAKVERRSTARASSVKQRREVRASSKPARSQRKAQASRVERPKRQMQASGGGRKAAVKATRGGGRGGKRRN